MNAQSRPALARGVRLAIDPITRAPLLLFPEGVLPLDETTHAIVNRCNAGGTVDAIVASLAEEYDADRDALLHDVLECLAQLRTEMLITVGP